MSTGFTWRYKLGERNKIAEIADRQLVYLRSNNSEPRHQHEASTMTDTRRAWSGAETACQPGRTYRFSTLGPLIFNPALQRDGSRENAPLRLTPRR